jgi:hypothetical protein
LLGFNVVEKHGLKNVKLRDCFGDLGGGYHVKIDTECGGVG